MMTTSERRRTERAVIEALADRLGWSMSGKRRFATTFTRDQGCRIAVGWADDGTATSGERIRPDGVVLVAKSWISDGAEVGRWVRRELEVGSRDTTLRDAGLVRASAPELVALGDELAEVAAGLRDILDRLARVRNIAESLGPVLEAGR